MAEHREQGTEGGDRLGGERREVAVEAIEDGPAGPRRSARAWTWPRTRPRDLVQRVAQVPLAPQPVDDLVARAAAGHVGDEVAEQAVDAAVVGRADGRRPISGRRRRTCSQPASRSRADSSARTPWPSAAASLSIRPGPRWPRGAGPSGSAARGSARRGRAGSTRRRSPALAATSRPAR